MTITLDMHKVSFAIAGTTYEVPATTLTEEQIRHHVAQSVLVKLTRASAGAAADKVVALRTARIATVYDIDGGGSRRSPEEVETVNLFHDWLKAKGEKSAALKEATGLEACQTLAARYLPDDDAKGTSKTRVDNLTAAIKAKVATILAARAGAEFDA